MGIGHTPAAAKVETLAGREVDHDPVDPLAQGPEVKSAFAGGVGGEVAAERRLLLAGVRWE